MVSNLQYDPLVLSSLLYKIYLFSGRGGSLGLEFEQYPQKLRSGVKSE